MKTWHNYGDINFIEYGGCLIAEDPYHDCFHVISLTTNIYDYHGKYKKPMIVAKCFIDLSDWLKPEDKDRKTINEFAGYEDNYIPQTLEEKMRYCVDLINYYGIENYDPEFPLETGCGCYALGMISQWIVGKTIAQKFMKMYGVPRELRGK